MQLVTRMMMNALCVPAVEVTATSPLRDSIASAYEADVTCSKMIKYLQNGASPVVPTQSRSHRPLRHGRQPVDLPRRSRGSPRVVVLLDDDLRERLIHEFS
ncbi:hypothetical protein PHMEG_0001050 [Phytophthora megakarya]|uniref:Uncharacterized protein n=1 Tax=Phytophthora megakarya TaxID=4795 RepID=A0A225X431_9STRA|nr:hypothetical protein PHMEG_0001050 [Phytophthora megakarya]